MARVSVAMAAGRPLAPRTKPPAELRWKFSVGSLRGPAASTLVCSARRPVTIFRRRSRKAASPRRKAEEIVSSAYLELFTVERYWALESTVKCVGAATEWA